uniref:Ig-like domain-containing protein n=1 Tax=Anas platyrhynchos TaxID=8839 RepID=A0A8B9TL59_ANAPL
MNRGPLSPGLPARQLLGLLRAESSPLLANPATRPRLGSATARQPCQGQHIATSCLRAGAASTASPQSAHTSLTSLQTLRTSPWAPAPGPCAVVPRPINCAKAQWLHLLPPAWHSVGRQPTGSVPGKAWTTRGLAVVEESPRRHGMERRLPAQSPASLPPCLEGTLGKGLGRGHLGSTEGRAGPQQRTCPISQALEWPKECPVDRGQGRAAKGLWHQEGLCSAPCHFPKRILSCSCYSVLLQYMVKDFRGKARPQALPPAASVGGRRAHPGRCVATGRVGEAMELRVVLLLPLCFPGLQAQTPGELSQREGSNLSVLCPHLAEDEYRELKSWCRWTVQGCQPEVEINGTRTYTYTERARQGHITIQGDPIHRNFSVTMTDLQVEDSGTYFCAYRKAWERFILLKRISLNVFKEFHKLELDSLSVQCPYRDQGYRSERKAWCRYAGQTGRCEHVVSTDTNYTRDISKAQKGRALIQDDTQKRTVTITMEKLQAQDSGVYWCALYRLYPTIRLTRIMEVRLSVAKRPAATTLTVTTGTSQNYPPGNSTQPHLWSFTLQALLGFFINKVLVILLLVFLQRRGCCRKKKCRAAEGSPGQLPEEERS